MPDAPDPLAAELAAIEKRYIDAGWVTADIGRLGQRKEASCADVPRLVAAVEAALATVARWRTEAADMDAAADRAAADEMSPPRTGFGRELALSFTGCADDLDRAISTALLGQDTAKGGSDAH